MSEYSFGGMAYSGGDPDESQDPGYGAGQQDQSPKWFRTAMEKMAEQNRNLGAQVESLLAEKRQTEIATAFEAKGFSRSAAALYQGPPDKLDDWLTAHGDALARSGVQAPAPQQQDTRPPGEMQPQGGLAPDVQANLQKMQQMGSGVAPQGSTSSDDELAAALRATTTPQEFLQVAQANGWQYTADNMGFM